jgi:hypothetical protein
MIRNIFKAGCLLLPGAIFAQTSDIQSGSYVQLYGGWGIQGSVKTEQIGIVHKRGDFNEFDTDFDLHVKVSGKSNHANFYTTAMVMGHVWTKNERTWNPGFELDVSRTYGKFNGTLVNQNDQEVHSINGTNDADVLELVKEHYGTGRHIFSNTMNMETWNLAGSFTFTVRINPKTSMYSGYGFGFSAVLFSDAQNLQISPAQSPPGYETTIDNGGGPVNHFNGKPKASSMLLYGQARLGAKIDVSKRFAFLIDTRVFCRDKGDFTFGSTQYSDHAPTNHWEYSIDKSTGIMLTVGVNFRL